jgi:uncharacterized protein (DUF983 family)
MKSEPIKPIPTPGKSYSILRLKCPRCHKGNLFVSRNAYNLKRMLDMPDRCPVCNQDFRIEPGFYSGALWVSFPMVVLLGLPIWILVFFFIDLSFDMMFLLFGITIFGLQPVIMRYSRAIWLNVFVKFDPNALPPRHGEHGG